jgi:hypothetical protein
MLRLPPAARSSPPMTIRARLGPFLDWGFWLWSIVGVGLGFCLSSLGVFLVLPLLVAIVFMVRQQRLRSSWPGALVGIGAVLLFVAYLQRQGPGVTCWQTATASGCDEHLDPLPWLVGGIVFVTAGFVAQAVRTGRPAT